MSHTPTRSAERPVKVATIDRREQKAAENPERPIKPHQLDKVTKKKRAAQTK